MNGHAEFLREIEDNLSGLSLEKDSIISYYLNRKIFAKLLNRFPLLLSKILSYGEGEIVKLLYEKKEAGSFRVLEEMYKYDSGNRGRLINQIIMESPAVKAARNRKKIAQSLLETCIKINDKDKMNILSIGGGSGSLELEVIKDNAEQRGHYICIDVDPDSIEYGEKLARRYNLEKRACFINGEITCQRDMNKLIETAERKFENEIKGIDIFMCQGVLEYLDLGSNTNDNLNLLLKILYDCSSDYGRLIFGQTDFHDRVKYLERGLGWYMHLRSEEEIKREIERAGWNIEFCQKEPMNLITLGIGVKEYNHSIL